jgi:S1-C subfamily serine protease
MANMLRFRHSFLLVTAVVLFLPHARIVRAEAEGGEKVYQRLMKSAVWVISPRSKAPGSSGKVLISSGSGSLLDARLRLVLTNYHVVEDREQVNVFFPHYQAGNSGKKHIVAEREYYTRLFSAGKSIRGKVVARNARSDLALIQLEAVPAGAVGIQLARESPAPGQRVHSIGNPGQSGALWVYTSGTVRQVYHKRWPARLQDKVLDLEAEVVETQSPTNPGDSGGPLVNDQGSLVGVTQGGAPSGSAQLLSTFIAVSEVKALLKRERLKVSSAPALASSESPSSPETERKAEQVSKAERDASGKLKLAKSLADDGLVDKAKPRLQEIVDSFPQTKAAEEARQLLEKLNK